MAVFGSSQFFTVQDLKPNLQYSDALSFVIPKARSAQESAYSPAALALVGEQGTVLDRHWQRGK
jgi:hypothetical protein